ncbi:DUF2612 domain-containing protein [uncultured Megasphaera sp.]|uniref:DUF2612 domain-containing protein n=1 Tax=uncultured Megasphaera sp. TaxID=165188 RepID=UPI00265CB201|nr:DUF2612 domain-containing protein [uncultured Megasphaera sp.]
MALLDNYLKLITSQHRDKPKYMAMVTALLRPSDDIFALAATMDDEFDVMLATGVQEDVVGMLVGTNRTLDFQPDKGLDPVLDNAAYRMLLQAKIAQNMWKGGIMDLRDLWATIFGNGIILQDNQNMTIDVVVIGNSFDQIVRNMIQKGMIVPKPQSVKLTTYFSDQQVFGYDMETNTIRGYDEANWIEENTKDSFAYDYDESGLFGYDTGNWT